MLFLHQYNLKDFPFQTINCRKMNMCDDQMIELNVITDFRSLVN